MATLFVALPFLFFVQSSLYILISRQSESTTSSFQPIQTVATPKPHSRISPKCPLRHHRHGADAGGVAGAAAAIGGRPPASQPPAAPVAAALSPAAPHEEDEEDEEDEMEEGEASSSSSKERAAGERQRKTRENYSVRKKRELIALAQTNGVREVCRAEGIPRRTLRQWMKDADKINAFDGPDSRKSIGRSGRREILPFARELAAFIKEKRRQREEMTSAHMIHFIKTRHPQWLESYLAGKKSAESGHAALTRLCQRFAWRHGFNHPSTPANGAEDANAFLFGVDIGTTAVKCVVVSAASGAIIETASVAYTDVGDDSNNAQFQSNNTGEQSVERILLSVQRAITSLPIDARRKITSIGICGQMHGIVWWNSSSVRSVAEKLLATGILSVDPDAGAGLGDHDRPWSKLINWQDQRCSGDFLAKCRMAIAAVGAVASQQQQQQQPYSPYSSPLATGYGLASFAHTLQNAPRELVGMDACGTIQDLVAFLLCGHSLPTQCCMDTTNAFSWGGFDLQTNNWNPHTVRALKIPSTMLPAVKKPGEIIGQTTPLTSQIALMMAGDPSVSPIASEEPYFFGLPPGKPVYVPMGDHPCSVMAALAQQQSPNDTNLTLVNIGTSAQLAIVLSSEDLARLPPPPPGSAAGSFEVRPFLFGGRFIGVAASLSGGNVYAWFVHQWQQWAAEMSLDAVEAARTTGNEAAVYERLIALGLARQNTDLVFLPTLNGERGVPTAAGSIHQLRMNNWSMGDISAALARGIIDNLFGMIPAELQGSIPVQRMIGTGNALVRNELLQHFLARKLAQPATQLTIQTAADAAVGAALTPSLLY